MVDIPITNYWAPLDINGHENSSVLAIDFEFYSLHVLSVALGIALISVIKYLKKRHSRVIIIGDTKPNGPQSPTISPKFEKSMSSTVEHSSASSEDLRANGRPRLTSSDWSTDADMGAIFGLDVGGTLSKLVYFEKTMEPKPLTQQLKAFGEVHTLDEVQLKECPPRTPPLKGHMRSTSLGSDVELPLDALPDLSLSRPTLKRVQSLSLLDNAVCRKTMEAFYTFMATQSGNKFIESLVHEAHLSFTAADLGGKLNFLLFETQHLEKVMALMGTHRLNRVILTLGCTGGGSFKYEEKLRNDLNIDIVSIDEMESLVRGLEFAISNVVGECYTYKPTTWPALSSQTPGGEKDWNLKVDLDGMTSAEFPFLLVSIGSGVSIIRVDGPGRFERVSGSSIGGGTFFGLARLISGCSSFDELLALAERGNHEECDMLVGDIYGRQYGKVGLSSSVVASSFGKLMNCDTPMESTLPEDRVRALLMMVTNNIGQVAYLNALQQKTSHIYFIGNFLRRNQISCQRLSYAIDYWSGTKMEALFLRHEGYFGAMGAFMLSADR